MASRALLILIAGGLLLPAPARSQRREGTHLTTVFSVELPSSVKFGEVSVPARRYRLSLSDEGFALADPTTMILVTTLPVSEQEATEAVQSPVVSVLTNGKNVSVVLRHGDRVYTATGVTSAEAQPPAPGTQVTLAGKHEASVAQNNPAEQSERALVEQALKRYIGSVKHCADSAQRARWGTQDPRFVKCVCPILEKWRLPRVSKPLRVHQPLAPGRSGFSLTATSDGRATECKVWTGATSPEQQAAPPPSAAAPDPAVAPH